MASKKKLERKIDQMVWLTKQEAMTYVDRCETLFDSQWKPYLNMYDNGGEMMFKKSQIDEFMEHRKVLTGKPFTEWTPRSISES